MTKLKQWIIKEYGEILTTTLDPDWYYSLSKQSNWS